jgi:uncharacterized alpha-E superfamily protein
MPDEFFKTERGRRFYDKDFPALVTQMKRIADSLEKLAGSNQEKNLQEKKERMKAKFSEAAAERILEKKKKNSD